MLNTVIAAATTVALFGLARHVLRDSLEAAIVAGIWALSPAVVETASHARQYDLLALCTVGFVWQVLRCAEVERPIEKRELIALALLTTAGALTHFHFPLIVSACGLLLVVRLVRRHRKRLLVSCLAIGAGCALFLALHPHFYQSVVRARRQAQVFRASDIVPRLEKTATCYASFFLDTTYIYSNVRPYF